MLCIEVEITFSMTSLLLLLLFSVLSFTLNDYVFQIPCETLYDVINALIEKTSGTLQPFLLEEPYEENISMTQSIYCT